MFSFSISYGAFVPNPYFDSNIGGWFTAYENPFPYHSADFGTVKWSSRYDGSAYLKVSGSPGVADLITFVRATINPGDVIKCRVTTGDMSSSTFCFQINGYWNTDVTQGAEPITQSNVTRTMRIVANETYPPGTPIILHLVCWPGYGEVWVDDVDLIRGD